MPPRRYKNSYKKRYDWGPGARSYAKGKRAAAARRRGPRPSSMLHFKKRGITSKRGFRPALKPRANPKLRRHTTVPEARGDALVTARKNVTLRYIELQSFVTSAVDPTNMFIQDVVPAGGHDYSCNIPAKVDVDATGHAMFSYEGYVTTYRAERIRSSRINVKFHNGSAYAIIAYIYIRSADDTSYPMKTRQQIIEGQRSVWTLIPGSDDETPTRSLNLAFDMKKDKNSGWEASLAGEPQLRENQWNATGTTISTGREWYYTVGTMFYNDKTGYTALPNNVAIEVTLDMDCEFRQPVNATAQ